MKNPLDTIREETTLLELFRAIMNESVYMDTIVKDIFEQQNKIKQKISRAKDDCISIVDDSNNLLKELNEKIEPRNLKCYLEKISYKELSIKEPEVELFKIGLAEHRKGKHIRIPKKEEQSIIIKNNDTCVSVPLFELIEKSGVLSKINNRIKSINLKCRIVKKSGRESYVLDFIPAFMCRQCLKICDTEEELKEHKKNHEMERKAYSSEISKTKSYKESQRKHEEYLKSRDRTR
jgi:hypothetical protein